MFFNSLQKVPYHYCRKRTEMLYLETLSLSKFEVYRCYLKYCEENGKEPYKFKRFSAIMDEMKIKIFKLRKDQCDLCVAYKNCNVSNEELTQHTKNKNEARQKKMIKIILS